LILISSSYLCDDLHFDCKLHYGEFPTSLNVSCLCLLHALVAVLRFAFVSVFCAAVCLALSFLIQMYK